MKKKYKFHNSSIYIDVNSKNKIFIVTNIFLYLKSVYIYHKFEFSSFLFSMVKLYKISS